MSQFLKYISNSDETKSIFLIIIYAILYLFLIFTAQSWIATFNSYYQQYIIKKEKPSSQDLLILSLILTIIFVFAVYFTRPRLPLFK
jgi:Na+/melibiose symporter-like transporter